MRALELDFVLFSSFAFFYVVGQLSVARSLGDLEIGSVYQLTIAATDQRGLTSSQSANVTLTIVDGESPIGGPVFSSASYEFEVDENAAVLTAFGGVTANSQDGNSVTYQLLNDQPNTNWFNINESNGKLFVAAEMDREILPNVTFQVSKSK